MSEQIDHPDHYNAGKIEAIDVIEDWQLNFSLGCVIKYLCRSEHKNSTIQDLEKAAWYLDREIQRRKNETPVVKNEPVEPSKSLLNIKHK